MKYDSMAAWQITEYGFFSRNLSSDVKSMEDVNFLAKAEFGLFQVLALGPAMRTGFAIAFNSMKLHFFSGIRLAIFSG